jgi:transposase
VQKLYANKQPFDFHNKCSSVSDKFDYSASDMAALSAILCNKDLKIYYERKVAEGKNKMAVINAVRNKLIHRIFACVDR